MRQVLEQFDGLLLQPTDCCAEDCRAVFEQAQCHVATNAQKSTNAFAAANNCTSLRRRTAPMIVVDMPPSLASRIVCSAYTAYFWLLIVPIWGQPRFFEFDLKSFHESPFWLRIGEKWNHSLMIIGFYLSMHRQTFFAGCFYRLSLFSSFVFGRAIFAYADDRTTRRSIANAILVVVLIISSVDLAGHASRSLSASGFASYRHGFTARTVEYFPHNLIIQRWC